MNDEIDNKELLERLIKVEVSVTKDSVRNRKIRKMFTRIVILLILEMAILILNTYFDWRIHGWQ